MPSRRPILTDIHDLNLDPEYDYSKTKRNGRLKEIEQVKSVSLITAEIPVETIITEQVVTGFVENELKQPLVEIVEDLINKKELSEQVFQEKSDVDYKVFETAQKITDEMIITDDDYQDLEKTQSTSIPEKEVIKLPQEKKKKSGFKSLKSNTNS